MAKYELVVTSDNVLSSPLTLTVLDIVAPRGETGPQGPSGPQRPSGPAGSTTLSALTDVDTTTATPSNGQVLTWDNTAGYWKPSTVSGGGGSGDITSVVGSMLRARAQTSALLRAFALCVVEQLRPR